MKICLLNDSFPPVIDGVANVVMNYADIMYSMEGNSVAVGTPRYPDTNYHQYPYMVVPYQSFDTTKLVNGYRAGNPFDVKEFLALKEFHPDIIHTHSPFSSATLARILRQDSSAPVVFTYHTKFDVDIARAVKAELLQKEAVHAIVSNIEACDDVWVVSEGAGENLRSLGYSGPYRVASNGVDFAKGRVDDKAVKEAVRDYDLPEGVPVFIFVGRIIKYKGLPMIIDACKILDKAGMDFRMVFIGSGPDADELKESSKELKNKVIFTGPIYDRELLRAWNTRADLFLFPSVYDTNGLVVREAAACGLPSVLIKGSCAAEGVTDGRNGYLIEESAEAMAGHIQEVCKDMAAVHEAGLKAMDEIYISWDDSVHRAYERYEELLEMKAEGKLKDRRGLYGKIEDAAATIAENTEKLSLVPFDIYTDVKDGALGMMDNFREFTGEVSTELGNFKGNLKDRLKENLERSMSEFKKTIKLKRS